MSKELIHRSLKWIEENRYELDEPVEALWKRLKTVQQVEQNENVSTACLEQKDEEAVIRYSNTFVNKNVRDGDNTLVNMSLLLLHEAFHDWRADLYYFGNSYNNIFWNLACDLAIHRDLYGAGFPQTESLTGKIYELTDVSALLIPPQRMIENLSEITGTREQPEWGYNLPLREKNRFKILFSWLRDKLGPIWRPNLPWNNPDRPRIDRLVRCYLRVWSGSMNRRTFFREIMSIFKHSFKLRFVALGGHGKGRGDSANSEDSTDKRQSLRISRFIKYLRRALVQTTSSKSTVRRRKEMRGVIPSQARRSTFLLAGGSWPVFFRRELVQEAPQQQGAHIYLDSSGSIARNFVDVVSSLLIGCSDLVAKPPHLFCSSVEDISLEKLKKGYRISGGTRIEPVLTHAKET